MDADDWVGQVYASKSNRELAERYDAWAATYEADMDDPLSYTVPQQAMTTFSKYVSTGTRILDAGAGTGWVGRLLHDQGYKRLVALDLSEGMLAEARKKNVYTDLVQGILGEPLDFPTNAFDAVISVGTFTLGHAPPGAFDELIRITRPSGTIVFTLHVDLYESDDFKIRPEPFRP
ncbi:MAG TPA: class I SAM-dependent methyltransferase [Anaerolineae bacterium]